MDTDGCANGESPDAQGGSSVTNNYQNTTYVNNTYQNDSYYNSSYLNETNQFENNTYEFENNTYENTTYENTTYENETFQNTTNMIDNDASLENQTNDNSDDEENLAADGNDSGLGFVELAVVALLLAIFIVQIVMVSKPKSAPFSLQQQGAYDEMESDEYDKIKDEFDTKTLNDEPLIEEESPPDTPSAADAIGKGGSEPHSEDVAAETTDQLPQTDSADEDSTVVQSSLQDEIVSPGEELCGSFDDNGYEWIEYPEGSGKNYYRIQDQAKTWVLWEQQD